ncbi:conserved Plasmodium protein, unknown function [Plasmodium chabaudi chabaudi]|uniref:ATP synthase F0 subunit a-like protein, putative n=2 Tax=Plasmodium chabaudi TaxID=5825 RepID=A0A077TM19_PLACU|nr:ATP synthase F0 subunit a-like protein, putative [Plasmodium chabaudi chabaudi]SCM19466.1 conserved Plasmodium protein, unknown function [Plasmodium chabaudi adami]SCM19896.1 conserved Plasmodium protein, unknown function [Plasmodium chabaudi chabaudi]SCN59137.1 conserved Plasmodium protein, unknown function [Plasmodium chabaudi chabaudi]VTZ67779.1 ATP synthase F0 subunit a-like protein, putative [Plasmodium chabaudi chabaudi]|eukprot:XP_016653464.1 conserved Plasmodium protein, unknown function [Plasmodium chabaudi chabaudi]
MNGKVFGKLSEGIKPYMWKSNYYVLNSYKNYTNALACLSKRYFASNTDDKLTLNKKKDTYKYYDDRLRGEITPVNLVKSLPTLNHYVSVLDMTKFSIKYILSYRFFFIYMARTTFQAVRPLMAFCVFGEMMKLVLATMTSGVFAFFFSFVLAFEVLYFFLQCYISYTFLTMFFDVMF